VTAGVITPVPRLIEGFENRMRAWRRWSTAIVFTVPCANVPSALPLPMVPPSDMRPTFCGTVMRATRSLARQRSL
jgi:hypothetical protein